MRFLSLLLLGLCAWVGCIVIWSSLVCEGVSVPYVGAVTMMRVLIVLHVIMVRV